MPDFSVIMTHTVGSCPMFKVETMQKFTECIKRARKETLSRRYQVTTLANISSKF